MPRVGESKRLIPNGVVIKHNIQSALSYLTTPINTITMDPNNARLHGDKNLTSIKDSLTRYGQCKPVVVRKSTGIVIAGNGTLAAALGLGWTHIAASIVDMDDIYAMAYALADNITSDLSDWDNQRKAQQLLYLEELGHRVSGCSDEDILRLRTVMVPHAATNQQEEIKEGWSIIVKCSSEADQLKLLDEMTKRGYECRALAY